MIMSEKKMGLRDGVFVLQLQESFLGCNVMYYYVSITIDMIMPEKKIGCKGRHFCVIASGIIFGL